MRKNYSAWPSLLIFFSLILASCSAALPTVSTQPAAPVTLRIALIPVLDALPMYVAQQEGLFQAHGVKVEFVPVASGAQRDQLISSGQADGMINEVLSTLFYNKEQIQVQTVRYARAATPDAALFRILAAKNSGIKSPQDLKGVGIGISQGTIIDYLTDRLLKVEGLKADEIKTVAVPGINDRMALLSSGELKAAMLPEPVSSLAIQQGATLILDDTKHPEYSFSTITFRKAVIDQHPEAIRAFIAAIEDAVQKINLDSTGWNDLLLNQKLLPPQLKDIFKVPEFVTKGVPTEAQWDDVVSWAKEKGLLDKDISYQESVTASFLPK